MIRILTGPIRSHKTTHLLQWVNGRDDCGGILSPDLDGLRQLYNIKTGERIAWQKEKVDASSDVVVGRFVFDHSAFEKASGWLDSHLADPFVKQIVLDEIGPLELSGKGWDLWLQEAIRSKTEKNFILVVREGLVEKVVAHYKINEFEVVGKEHFQTMGDR